MRHGVICKRAQWSAMIESHTPDKNALSGLKGLLAIVCQSSVTKMSGLVHVQ